MEQERYVALLGDVVGSRLHSDSADRQRRLVDALKLANERAGGRQPLMPTIGDEFQGIYDDLVSALDATLVVRLALLDGVDVRFGIGSGALRSFDPASAPFAQDGPAWWSARAAVDEVREIEQRQESPRGLRTRWVDAEPADPRLPAAVNAFLLCRDELVASMDARDAATMLGLLADRPLTKMAKEQNVSVSALSQRAIRGGLYAIRRAHEQLREVAG